MGGLALARDARDGRSRSADGGGRRRRRDLEPDDLREGALDGRLVRRAAARGARALRRYEGGVLRARRGGHQARLRSAAARVGAHRRRRRLRLDRGRSGSRLRAGGHVRAGEAPARARRSEERVREDPRDRARHRRDRGLDRRRPLHQRDPHLLARPLLGRGRGVRPRARAARRGRRRSRRTSPRSRASSSRASTPSATDGSPRSAARTSRDGSRSTTPSSPTSATRRSSPGRAGRLSPPRAHVRSAACGRRPRRRTRRIGTSSTSRS